MLTGTPLGVQGKERILSTVAGGAKHFAMVVPRFSATAAFAGPITRKPSMSNSQAYFINHPVLNSHSYMGISSLKRNKSKGIYLWDRLDVILAKLS